MRTFFRKHLGHRRITSRRNADSDIATITGGRDRDPSSAQLPRPAHSLARTRDDEERLRDISMPPKYQESLTDSLAQGAPELAGVDGTDVPVRPTDASAGIPTFEGLPPEIRLQVFEFGLGLEDLRATIRASPAFYRQYRASDRKLLLRAALEGSLGPVAVDAWAAHNTFKLDLVPPVETAKKRIAEL